jgi:hypothetical protein
MNWGKAIVLSFVAFIAFVGVLVVLSVREDVSLVSENYYPEDRAYGEQIARMKNAVELAEHPAISIDAGARSLVVSFPEGYADLVESGKVVLFRPSDKSLDQTFELNSGFPSPFALASLEPGRYKVMLTWTMGGKEYYIEKSFNV